MSEALPPGTRLGPYEIDSIVGAGGMGQVYRARDPRLGRHVAIKTLSGLEAADPDRIRRFETEARATGTLDHPGGSGLIRRNCREETGVGYTGRRRRRTPTAPAPSARSARVAGSGVTSRLTLVNAKPRSS